MFWNLDCPFCEDDGDGPFCEDDFMEDCDDIWGTFDSQNERAWENQPRQNKGRTICEEESLEASLLAWAKL